MPGSHLIKTSAWWYLAPLCGLNDSSSSAVNVKPAPKFARFATDAQNNVNASSRLHLPIDDLACVHDAFCDR